MYRIIRRHSGLNTCPVCHDRDCPGCDYDDEPAEPDDVEPADDDGDDARAEAAWSDWRERVRDEQIA